MSDKVKPWARRPAQRRHSDPKWKRHSPEVLNPFPVAPTRPVSLQCTKKRTYNDPTLAREMARLAMERSPHVQVRPYTCPHCLLIHIGHYDTE